MATTSTTAERASDSGACARPRDFLIVSAWALLPTFVGVLLYYPGLVMTDTAARSIQALAMYDVRAWREGTLSNWFPHALTALYAASMRLFGSLGPLLPLMLFWTFASVGWLITAL